MYRPAAPYCCARAHTQSEPHAHTRTHCLQPQPIVKQPFLHLPCCQPLTFLSHALMVTPKLRENTVAVLNGPNLSPGLSPPPPASVSRDLTFKPAEVYNKSKPPHRPRLSKYGKQEVSNLQREIVHPMEAKTQGPALCSPAPAQADTACTERTLGVWQEGVV